MLVVEHDHGGREMSDSRGYRLEMAAGLDFSIFNAFVLAEGAVACDVVAAAGLSLMSDCGRCRRSG